MSESEKSGEASQRAEDFKQGVERVKMCPTEFGLVHAGCAVTASRAAFWSGISWGCTIAGILLGLAGWAAESYASGIANDCANDDGDAK